MIERIYSRIQYLERRENLENTKKAIEEFEKEYWWDMEDIRKQEREERMCHILEIW